MLNTILLNPILWVLIYIIIKSDSIWEFLFGVGIMILIGLVAMIIKRIKYSAIEKKAQFIKEIVGGDVYKFDEMASVREEILKSPKNLSENVTKLVSEGFSLELASVAFKDGEFMIYRKPGIFSYFNLLGNSIDTAKYDEVFSWSIVENTIQLKAYCEEKKQGVLIWLSVSNDKDLVDFLQKKVTISPERTDLSVYLHESAKKILIMSNEKETHS